MDVAHDIQPPDREPGPQLLEERQELPPALAVAEPVDICPLTSSNAPNRPARPSWTRPAFMISTLLPLGGRLSMGQDTDVRSSCHWASASGESP